MQETPPEGRVLPWPTSGGQGEEGAVTPPDGTGAEQFFYRKHMQRRTPMVMVMVGGEKHRGWIEWYDQDVLKLHNFTESNLFIRKDEIKYIYRNQDEEGGPPHVPTPPPVKPRRSSRRRGGGRRQGPGRV
ncbi:MAG: hypothetical protein O7F11_03160 [Acidobacteria bacterium]|jgi:hypothetical protein|nr:hypothetical protein [Acidobacteriota bacterium]MCZ6832722.1 hypothetical protein [Acidobacteriota bacterium]